jgi:hypothetical protein
MLPTTLSKVLGISLDEVMCLYFDGSEESVRVRRVEEAMECRMMAEEGEAWLACEASRLAIELERDQEGGDDTF